MALPSESQKHSFCISGNGVEKEISTSSQTKAQNISKSASKFVPKAAASLPCSQPSSVTRVVTDGISSYVYILVRGARGAVEALIIDVKEVTWWLLRLCMSDQTFTRFHDQWQILLSGASTSPEDEPLEKLRRRRSRTFVRLLGSLIPLAPVQRPYLRFVALNSLTTSDDSLYNGSLRSGSVRSLRTSVAGSRQQLQSIPAAPEHKRPQLLRSEGATNLSGYSNESGFSTAHCLDSDTSSCVDNDLLDEDTEGDHRSITSGYSMAASEAAGLTRRRKSQLKRRHSRRPESSAAGAQQRGSALESSLPFTDPAALEKIKSLETQLEQLKQTISQIMSQQKGDKAPPTPPSSPIATRRAPPPPPPPPTPSAPPPPPPPMPPTPTTAGGAAGGTKGSLQELLQSKQGQLSKAEVNATGPKEQPGSWSSVISAIKGGGAKLKKVQRPPPSKKPVSSSSNTGDAYRAALAATLRQRFKSVQGSDDDTEAEYSDSDAVKSGRWDSEAWQSPSSDSKSSLPQALVWKERLKKTSPVKLAKEIKNSPDALLAAVNEKLYSAVSEDKDGSISSSGALIFSTPKSSLLGDQPEDQVPDSNELFRKFLQSDRKKRVLPPKNLSSRSQSTPSFAPMVRSASIQDSISTIPETPQSAADAGVVSTPVVGSSHKPRALSFSTGVQQSPFGQHLLKKRVSVTGTTKSSTETRPAPANGPEDGTVESPLPAAVHPGKDASSPAGGDPVPVAEKVARGKLGSSPEGLNETLYLSFESGNSRKSCTAQFQSNQ